MASNQNLTSNDSFEEYYDPIVEEDAFDYYNIEHRINYMMTRPYDVMAVILGLVAILLNALVLAALFHVRSRITNHYRLIVSLAFSDMLVGGSVLFFIINKALNPTYTLGRGPEKERLLSQCFFMIIKALNNVGLNITLLKQVKLWL